MRIYETKDYESLSRKAANIIAAQVILNPNCVLGLATGSTPIGTYKRLVEMYKDGDLSFKNVKSVNLDEYKSLSPEHDQSYRYFMQTNLFDYVDIKSENTNVPNGLASNAEEECDRYNNVIKNVGGIDIQLLGLGHNGHIGFNEPSDNFPLDTHLVDLTESTIKANTRFFSNENEVPRQAFTMGIRTIMQAKSILVIASGKDKAEIVCKAFSGPVTPNVPASILQLHQNVTLICDEEAMSLLRKTGVKIINC